MLDHHTLDIKPHAGRQRQRQQQAEFAIFPQGTNVQSFGRNEVAPEGFHFDVLQASQSVKIQLSASANPELSSTRGNSVLSKPYLVLWIAAWLAFNMWFFVDRVWAPPVDIHFSDLYPRWYGSHELLLHGRDPYGPEVTRDIQIWNYGRALQPGEPRDECRFNYPLYIVFLFAPTVGLSFSKVVTLFRWMLPTLACITVLLWVSMLRWRCSKPILGSLVLVSFGSFPVLESVYLQQPALIATFFLAAAGAALTAGRLRLAGLLLAFSTIKPQLAILLVPWLMLWAVYDWRSRKNLVWSFGAAMALLFGASQIVNPGWFGEFLVQVAVYRRFIGNVSVLNVLLGQQIGNLAAVGLVLGLALVTWALRGEAAGCMGFNLAVCMILVATVLIIPTLFPTSQVLLQPAIFFLLMNFRVLWAKGKFRRLAYVASLSLLAWPLLASSVFALASLLVPLSSLRRLWLIPLSTVPLAPVALAVMFAILMPEIKKATGETSNTRASAT